jgi:hypothetical protein
MKHIKQFVESYQRDEYYHSIDNFYSPKEMEKRIIPSVKEIESFIKKLSKFVKIEKHTFSENTSFSYPWEQYSLIVHVDNPDIFKGGYEKIKVFFYDDEWYGIVLENDNRGGGYKCDQFEGVIYLLQDKGIIR